MVEQGVSKEKSFTTEETEEPQSSRRREERTHPICKKRR
jgi:hypothetical protein